MKIKNMIAVFAATASLIGDDLPNGHAPISIMADHFHKKGEIMFSYRFMNMAMTKNFQGKKEISPEMIMKMGYDHYGSSMNMQMHMIGAMYGLSNKITLMAMINIISSNMEMTNCNCDDKSHMMKLNMADSKMNHSISGLGDASITAMYAIQNSESMKVHLNFGASLPTGSIQENHEMDMNGHHHHKIKSMMKMRNGYGMQLGSGTIDPIASLTIARYMNDIAIGLQGGGRMRSTENENNYKLGNEFYALAWAGYNLNNSLSLGSVFRYKTISSISGYDKEIMKDMGPSSDPKNSGKSLMEVSVGVNYLVPESLLHGARVAIEYGIPITSDYTGVQMGVDGQLTLGLQYTIK